MIKINIRYGKILLKNYMNTNIDSRGQINKTLPIKHVMSTKITISVINKI